MSTEVAKSLRTQRAIEVSYARFSILPSKDSFIRIFSLASRSDSPLEDYPVYLEIFNRALSDTNKNPAKFSKISAQFIQQRNYEFQIERINSIIDAILMIQSFMNITDFFTNFDNNSQIKELDYFQVTENLLQVGAYKELSNYFNSFSATQVEKVEAFQLALLSATDLIELNKLNSIYSKKLSAALNLLERNEHALSDPNLTSSDLDLFFSSFGTMYDTLQVAQEKLFKFHHKCEVSPTTISSRFFRAHNALIHIFLSVFSSSRLNDQRIQQKLELMIGSSFKLLTKLKTSDCKKTFEKEKIVLNEAISFDEINVDVLVCFIKAHAANESLIFDKRRNAFKIVADLFTTNYDEVRANIIEETFEHFLKVIKLTVSGNYSVSDKVKSKTQLQLGQFLKFLLEQIKSIQAISSSEDKFSLEAENYLAEHLLCNIGKVKSLKDGMRLKNTQLDQLVLLDDLDLFDRAKYLVTLDIRQIKGLYKLKKTNSPIPLTPKELTPTFRADLELLVSQYEEILKMKYSKNESELITNVELSRLDEIKGELTKVFKEEAFSVFERLVRNEEVFLTDLEAYIVVHIPSEIILAYIKKHLVITQENSIRQINIDELVIKAKTASYYKVEEHPIKLEKIFGVNTESSKGKPIKFTRVVSEVFYKLFVPYHFALNPLKKIAEVDLSNLTEFFQSQQVANYEKFVNLKLKSGACKSAIAQMVPINYKDFSIKLKKLFEVFIDLEIKFSKFINGFARIVLNQDNFLNLDMDYSKFVAQLEMTDKAIREPSAKGSQIVELISADDLKLIESTSKDQFQRIGKALNEAKTVSEIQGIPNLLKWIKLYKLSLIIHSSEKINEIDRNKLHELFSGNNFLDLVILCAEASSIQSAMSSLIKEYKMNFKFAPTNYIEDIHLNAIEGLNEIVDAPMRTFTQLQMFISSLNVATNHKLIGISYKVSKTVEAYNDLVVSQ